MNDGRGQRSRDNQAKTDTDSLQPHANLVKADFI
jgi:hypothetical protein